MRQPMREESRALSIDLNSSSPSNEQYNAFSPNNLSVMDYGSSWSNAPIDRLQEMLTEHSKLVYLFNSSRSNFHDKRSGSHKHIGTTSSLNDENILSELLNSKWKLFLENINQQYLVFQNQLVETL